MPLQTAQRQLGPRSLQRMCIAVAQRNVASITDLGELPLESALPILRHVENPAQLHDLEQNCPQLAAAPEQLAALWTRLLAKKFPRWEDRDDVDITDDMSYYDIFVAIKEAVDRETAAATANLQRQLAGFSKAKTEGNTKLVGNNRALLSKLPGVKKRGQNGHNAFSKGNYFSFGGGTRTHMTTGQSVMRRARREAKEMSKVTALSTPMKSLRVAQGQILKAPAAMVHDYRVANNPDVTATSTKLLSIQAKTKRPTSPISRHSAAETRLLALKSGGSTSTSTSSSSSSKNAIVRPLVSKATADREPAARPAVSGGPRPPKRRHQEEEEEEEKNRRPAFRGYSHYSQYKDVNDDDLFGDNEEDDDKDKPPKKSHLSVDDLERPEASSGRPRKSAKTLPGMSGAAGQTSSSTPVDERTRGLPSPDEDMLSPPRTYRKPALQTSPVSSAGAAAPIRRKGKAVDIFMRPKKR